MIDHTNKFYEVIKKKSKQSGIDTHKILNQQLLPKKQQQQTSPDYKKDVIIEASVTILNTIKSLDTLLHEHKEAYISTTQQYSRFKSAAGVTGGGGGMTDQERDEIDKISTNQIEICKSSIKQLETLVTENYVKDNQYSKYFKKFSKDKGNLAIMSTVDLIREDPLDLFSSSNAVASSNKSDSITIASTRETLERYGPKVVLYINILDQLKSYLNTVSNIFKKIKTFRLSIKMKETEKFHGSSHSKSFYQSKNNLLHDQDKVDNIYGEDVEFTEEEIQLYERQNETLITELETLNDQIDVINKQLEELSTLFDEITPHVLSQREIIDNIYSTNVDATNYIIRGNNQIAEATKKSFDFRVMLLAFLITSSLTLLFLHWYHN
ncbi:hypothetical protein CYY_008119 [Polysphondylium violaceum]|uniref:t-SNARE coiled-coil homology domain-containing protein n=1 Tax=Polysphondylium violaceum TaxID=133409 RepID=A0A8J4PM53_9MYCE|nr:hypothetical protein CYY_008119 [Polysphondylium violaceum]